VPNSRPIVAIVDDDHAIGNAIEVLLRSVGSIAKAFSSGEEFLRSPELSRTGCLVVDFNMPGMSGLDLHNNLSQLGKRDSDRTHNGVSERNYSRPRTAGWGHLLSAQAVR